MAFRCPRCKRHRVGAIPIRGCVSLCNECYWEEHPDEAPPMEQQLRGLIGPAPYSPSKLSHTRTGQLNSATREE